MSVGNDNWESSRIIDLIRRKNSAFWMKERETRALKLFYDVSKKVPAYKDFLRKNRIDPNKIKSFRDFSKIPTVTKKNYLRKYKLDQLVFDGKLKKPLVWTSTSGSTGEPFYFPRGKQLDWEGSVLHELFYLNGSRKLRGPTLVIVGFGMGVWIAGLFTYKAFEIPSRNEKYEISIITPGINKLEIFKVLKNLSPYYSEVILTGYPPFIKDIVDEAKENSVDFSKTKLRLLFAAEPFTEKFRDHVSKMAGIRNVFRDTMNIYGTADIGAIAFETPTSILARRLAISNQKLFENIFSKINKTPTLAQYNPLFVTFEENKGDLILTANSELPLVRYEIGDHGGVHSYSEMVAKIRKSGFSFKIEAEKKKIGDIFQLPFVHVYERKDFSTTLYGLQIYPETVREALLSKMLSKQLTGKFTMLTKFDSQQNQYLEINLELQKKQKVSDALRARALKEIITILRKKNSEFRELHDYLKNKALPHLIFWPYEHPTYFKSGIKQKWVQKNGKL